MGYSPKFKKQSSVVMDQHIDVTWELRNANYWDPFQTYWIKNCERGIQQKPSVFKVWESLISGTMALDE